VFRSVLVANRGEIALRVIRTLRELGIRSIAVYSAADEAAPHVLAADDAVAIGPAPPRESYLNVDRILSAARETGAEAIHPGYGFLSESAAFARQCAGANLTFIGPSPETLEAAGDKTAARRSAESVGVPIVPGAPPSADFAGLARSARKLPLPLLVKAAAGGGGKGMRRVATWEALEEALRSGAREAEAAFGDGTLLIESYVHPARHVEVQILGDGRGGVAALGERECSLQRRYQKIVEEAPSPALDPALRTRLLEAARRVAAAVRYGGAGTVEFLLGPDGGFYFLEINARLQVEHPVTELMTGLDLVRLQLEIAAGDTIDLEEMESHSRESAARGHAIEARLYAEDPSQEFLPTTGTIAVLRWSEGPGVRIDSGIQPGQIIGSEYDPLLAKLIAWAPDREQARRRLAGALEETVLLGLRTNQAFLREILGSEAFQSGHTFTHTVEGEPGGPGLVAAFRARESEPLSEVMLAAAVMALGQPVTILAEGAAANGYLGAQPVETSPWRTLGAWRLGAGAR
jgi:acetyl/propionyl-CoA carboxylase alpha subunit